MTTLDVIITSVFLVSGCTNSEISRNFYRLTEDSFGGKTFPFIYIDTQDNKEILSKEEYLTCNVNITNTDTEYVFQDIKANIKGRGNSSWNMPKKSYKLKFDSKVDLFGFGKAKKWTLIANYCDKSLSRNLLAYELARTIGLQETTCAQPVNLIVNGDYYGVYLLCEQTEIGKTRVNIESDLKDIDTGYLIEMDGRAKDEGILGVDYFQVDGKNYVIKDPETDDEDFSEEHFEFIKSYMEECYQAIKGNDYEKIEGLIDVESFAKCYIIHEMFNCVDVGFASFYFYKKSGDKLFAGPVWDFDISSGNCDYAKNSNDTNYLYAKNNNVWYNELLKFNEFQSLVKRYIKEYKDPINEKIDEVITKQLEYKENNSANFEVWNILYKYVWPNSKEIVNIKTFEGQLEYLKNWVGQKFSYMEEYYCSK